MYTMVSPQVPKQYPNALFDGFDSGVFFFFILDRVPIHSEGIKIPQGSVWMSNPPFWITNT